MPLKKEHEQSAQQIKQLSYWLDSAIRLPGGFRIGLDGIIGVVPVVGDVVGALLSAYIVMIARKMGVPKPLLLRMCGNVVLELVVGIVPVFGDIFDFAFRANQRNLALAQNYVKELERASEPKPTRRTWLLVIILLLVVVLSLATLI